MLKAAVTEQRYAMRIESLKTTLLSWPQCTEKCSYPTGADIVHAGGCDGTRLFIAGWLGKGILALFDPILREHAHRVRVKPLTLEMLCAMRSN